jgi:hypothetical protein
MTLKVDLHKCCGMILCFASIFCRSQVDFHPAAGLPQIYGQLLQLVTREGDPLKGLSAADRKEMRRLRAALGGEDAGALFIIGKLEEMNVDETSHLEPTPGPFGECESALTGIASKNALMKYQLFQALGESYSRRSRSVQVKVLDALERSYTPSVACDVGGGRQVLDLALIRTGKNSVEVFIRLGGSRYESIRCGAEGNLNSFADGHRSDGDAAWPPVLDCHAPEGVFEGQLANWHQWWESNRATIRWPKLPDPEDY